MTLPYLTGDQQRPAVLVAGPAEQPLFAMALLDYYRSNASTLFALNQVADDGATCNGGSRYLPRTDGRRNDCFERLFLTVSPRLEEVLPNIPNPRSPWMHVAGQRLWRAHGPSNRQSDYEPVEEGGPLWDDQGRDHRSRNRLAGRRESFTFRTRAAPGKGGDEGQADYARKIRSLGFLYGIYNNYTDYAPVNEYWQEDRVKRTARGGPVHGGVNGATTPSLPGRSNSGPSWPLIIQKKFHLDTAYCDVHTAVPALDYV